MVALNSNLAEIDWQALFDHFNTENENNASHDDIPAKILKDCKHSISTPLTLLWKWSMETALIPSHLKTQFVAPIYKKGDKHTLLTTAQSL